MRRIRYLVIMMLLLCNIAIFAQTNTEFNPASPAEPNAPDLPKYSQLTLVADPVGGGNPSTSGKVIVGSTVNLSANKASGFRFVSWTNAKGEILSTSESFKMIKADSDEVVTAHYLFEPDAPGEPTDPWLQLKVQLNVIAAEGGSVSGGGKYLPGSSITLNASPASNYSFDSWTDQSGQVVSTAPKFSYVVKNVMETLTAHFTFTPVVPEEPLAPDMTPKHHVFISADEGGAVSASRYDKEGTNVSVSALCNSDYEFLGWFKDNVLYNSNISFTHTIGTDDVSFVAHFRFNPSSPEEPNTPNNAKRHIFYIENANGFQGENIKMSVFLSSLHEIGNMTFQLSFPEEFLPDESRITYSDLLEGYTKTCTKVDATTLKFEFTGGELPVCNGALVTFLIHVPEDYPTGTRNPVRMNQISFVEVGGSSTTTIARNANLGVFKRGDVNGDNTIDIADVHGMMLNLASLIDATDGFITEAADVNMDGFLDNNDLATIVALAQTNAADSAPLESNDSLYIISPLFSTPGVTLADDKSFSVSLVNEVDIWGVQFDMMLPEGMTISTKDKPLVPCFDRMGGGDENFELATIPLEDGWTRVFVYPTTAERFITGFEGEIVKIYYCTTDNMEVGDASIQLRNVKLALQGMELDYPNFGNANVCIHQHNDVDGYCTICGELVSYSRQVSSNEIGTICLPKGATSANVFGAVCYRLIGKRMADADVPMSLVIEEVAELEAGIPYFYVVEQGATQMKVVYSGAMKNEASTFNGLIGSFTDCCVNEGSHILSNNVIVESDSNCSVNANSAYINMADVPVVTTSITDHQKEILLEWAVSVNQTLVSKRLNNSIYNISGFAIPYLVKGIQIVNGRKYLQR